MNIAPVTLAERVERWQARLTLLGVGGWRFSVKIVDETPGGPNAEASAVYSPQYDTCEFYFTHDFLDGVDEWQLDETILHEWVHVALRDLDEVALSASRWMPEASAEQYEHYLDREREGVVDRVARMLYDLYQSDRMS